MSHTPRKRFGQNFLQDEQIIHRIIQSIAPKKEDHLVEIGPGLGALTEPLLELSGKLSVIEIDRDIIPRLKNQFGHADSFHVFQTDVLKFDFTNISDDKKPLRIVGNLPYNISTPVLFYLLGFSAIIQDLHFMLQKEVVERITALPGSRTYGQLSVILQQQFQTTHLFNVHPEAFMPAPKVESAIIKLQPHQQPPYDVGNDALFRKIVKQAFSQRRKTLRNTLKPLLNEHALRACDIDPGARAETLPLSAYARLSAFLYQSQEYAPDNKQ